MSDRIEDEALAAELGERSRLMIFEYAWRVGMDEEEADRLLREGEAWAQRRGDSHARAALYNAWSMVAVLVHGRTRRAQEVVEEGLALMEGSDDRVLELALELRRYLVADFIGRVEDMERYMARVHTFSREEMDACSELVGYDVPALAIGYQGNAARHRGHFAEALTFYRQGLEIARERGADEVASWTLALQSECFACLGDLPRAGEEMRRPVEALSPPGAVLLLSSHAVDEWQTRYPSTPGETLHGGLWGRNSKPRITHPITRQSKPSTFGPMLKR